MLLTFTDSSADGFAAGEQDSGAVPAATTVGATPEAIPSSPA